MRKAIPIILLISVGSIIAQKPETRNLRPFNKVSIQDRVIVILKPDTLNQITLTPQGDAWNEEVKTNVNGTELDIYSQGRFRDSKVFCYLHYTMLITKLTARYGGIFRTDSLSILETKKLEVDANIDGFANLDVSVEELIVSAGSGSDIYIKGKAGKVTVYANSGAKVHMDELECENAEVTASMGAKVWLTAKVNYKASAGSGGKIYYYSEPSGTFERSRITGGNVELVNQ